MGLGRLFGLLLASFAAFGAAGVVTCNVTGPGRLVALPLMLIGLMCLIFSDPKMN